MDKKELDEILAEQINYVNNLSPEEDNELKQYVRRSDFINYPLARLRYISENEDKRMFNVFEKIFSEIPPTTNPIIVYRAVLREHNATLGTYTGRYISTTYSPDYAMEFLLQIYFEDRKWSVKKEKKVREKLCCIFQITVSPMSKVIPIYASKHEVGQFEILLDRRGKLNIIGREGNLIYATYTSNRDDLMFCDIRNPCVGDKVCNLFLNECEPERYIEYEHVIQCKIFGHNFIGSIETIDKIIQNILQTELKTDELLQTDNILCFQDLNIGVFLCLNKDDLVNHWNMEEKYVNFLLWTEKYITYTQAETIQNSNISIFGIVPTQHKINDFVVYHVTPFNKCYPD